MRDPEALLGATIEDCKCEHVHIIPTKYIYSGRDSYDKIPGFIGAEYDRSRILIISDLNTCAAAGERLEQVLTTGGIPLCSYVIPTSDPFILDDGLIQNLSDELSEEIKAAEMMIAVGAGTINDLVKYIASQRDIPYIAVPTAASMNGYTSSIAAIKRNGVKETVPAKPAAAVFVDPDVIYNAPNEMTHAGLGDIVSRSVSTADWKLASLLNGDPFCMLPYKIVASFEEDYFRDDIDLSNPGTTTALMNALLYSGIGMTIAGSSAPASGAEHLVSHFLDMHAPYARRTPDFHGAQVGVATIFTAALYEKLMGMNVDGILDHSNELKNRSSNQPTLSQTRMALRNYWGPEIGEQVYERYTGKFEDNLHIGHHVRLVHRLLSRWETVKKELQQFLAPAGQIKAVLKNAGAKTTFYELGVSTKEFMEAVLGANKIRNRYTILDILERFNLLEEWTDDILGKGLV